MKCRNAQMLLWRFLICIPISGKQLYFTFTCEASLVACLSLGTGVLSWSLPTDSHAGGISWGMVGCSAVSALLVLCPSSEQCCALRPAMLWAVLSENLPLPEDVSMASLQNLFFFSPLSTALVGWEAAVMFRKRQGFLCFSILQPWYSLALQMGGGLPLVWLPQAAYGAAP